ncbi:YcxB family protein [Promicromonospora kroppenstedtii]|uniref:YcxB family protein n=1 Tax=Promicromonospora kroppenstedtii TaxID=440482 RepID=UPI000566509C|nr:YcxB family protein [Promicromonospora kroppenstedtii]
MTPDDYRPTTASTSFAAAYDFTPTQSDYADLLRTMPQLRTLKGFAWGMLAVLAVAVLMGFFLVHDDGQPAIDATTLVPLTVAAAVATLFAFGYARFGGRAAWRKPLNREPIHAVLDSKGFRHEGPSGSQSFTWNVATRALETNEAYYVYVPNGLASLVYWLPKRAVPLADQASVRAHIQAHVKRYRLR